MMPKPKQNTNNIQVNTTNTKRSSERILYESQPNMLLYSDNFIFKIVVLFILAFMFNPILLISYKTQSWLQSNFQLQFNNMTYIVELLLFLCIIIILIKLALDFLDWKNTTYVLSDTRIVINRGFLNKERITMPYSKVQDIDISQSILERILNAGDIVIYGGHDNSETILDDVPNPKEVEEIILENVNKLNYQYSQVPQANINRYQEDVSFNNYDNKQDFNNYNDNNYKSSKKNKQYKDYPKKKNSKKNNTHYFNISDDSQNKDYEIKNSFKNKNYPNSKQGKNLDKDELLSLNNRKFKKS